MLLDSSTTIIWLYVTFVLYIRETQIMSSKDSIHHIILTETLMKTELHLSIKSKVKYRNNSKR